MDGPMQKEHGPQFLFNFMQMAFTYRETQYRKKCGIIWKENEKKKKSQPKSEIAPLDVVNRRFMEFFDKYMEKLSFYSTLLSNSIEFI